MSYFCTQLRILKMLNNNTLERKIAVRISRKKSTVILRKDFDDLGGYDQVGRALRTLAAKGKIMKIGYGLYARTTLSSLSGKPVPENPCGSKQLLLFRESVYADKSTQVPPVVDRRKRPRKPNWLGGAYLV